MATFKPVIEEHWKKEENTWNVKIRLIHKRRPKYIDTPFFVTKKHLTQSFELKDDFVYDAVHEIIKVIEIRSLLWVLKLIIWMPRI
ncbi:hypothetical protein [Pararcticibacter amylolyticus]|nr:hypothetical protein [Pararcticibacter amylolyticus]